MNRQQKALEATLPGPFNLTVARQKKQEGPRSLREWGRSAFCVLDSVPLARRPGRRQRMLQTSLKALANAPENLLEGVTKTRRVVQVWTPTAKKDPKMKWL